MKLNVGKNAIRTMVFGIINKTIMIILPFVVRTIMIKELGVEYGGIGSLFTSILQVLSLTELGFGSAMVFNMYKPIAENNIEKICQLLNFYRKVYRIMGGIVLFIGGIAYIFLDVFVNGDIPTGINIRILFLLYLINTVIGYFTFSYKSSLLFAHQRYDIYNNVLTILNVVNYIYQGFALVIFKNYYAYIITMPVVTVLVNIICARIVDKRYPMYKPSGSLSSAEVKDIRKRVFALAGHKIGGVLTNSFDNIVISTFLGFYILGKYNNYYYITNSLNGFLIIATNALTAGIGNQMVREKIGTVKNGFMEISALFCWIIGWCSICLVCLFQPFISTWVGNDMLLPFSTVLCLSLYFYVYNTRYIISIYKDANGMWGADVLKPYVEGFSNLFVNILLVKHMGVNGVVISTILTMGLIGMPWETHALFKGYFVNGERKYWIRRFQYALLTIMAAVPTFWICNIFPNSIKGIVIRSFICILIPNAIYCTIAYMAFNEYKSIVKRAWISIADIVGSNRKI